MGRPFEKHIDAQELSALVAFFPKNEPEAHRFPPDAIREAENHVKSCRDCRGKVSKYRELINRSWNVVVSEVAPPGAGCPQDVDWHEVAAGLWPELKAKQLILHAALCNHCGPLLRAATSVDDDPGAEEAALLAELRAPSRPISIPPPVPPSPSTRSLIRWLVPALALMVIAIVVVTIAPSSRTFSGQRFAEFAVNTHRQHAEGGLTLDVHSDSQLALNQWLKAKSPFSLALPASPALPGEERPYRLQGARLVQASGKTAVYIAYQMQSGPVSLMVAPDSLAVASGGFQVDYKTVSFHYRTVKGFRVVTWSLHGNTYALVSQEGNSSQRSCMVCHSAMRDRDLSQTPVPVQSLLQ